MAPYVNGGDGGDGPVLVTEERDAVQSGPGEELVDNPDLVVQQPKPGQGGDDVGDEKGQQERAADERRLDQPSHQHRQPDRKQGLKDDVEQNVLQRDHQRVPEQLVVGDLDEVVEADEVRGSEQGVLRKAEVETPDRGIQIEDQEANRGRRDEQQRHSQLVPSGSGLALRSLDGKGLPNDFLFD